MRKDLFIKNQSRAVVLFWFNFFMNKSLLPRRVQIPHNLLSSSAKIIQNIWDTIEKKTFKVSVVRVWGKQPFSAYLNRASPWSSFFLSTSRLRTRSNVFKIKIFQAYRKNQVWYILITYHFLPSLNFLPCHSKENGQKRPLFLR